MDPVGSFEVRVRRIIAESEGVVSLELVDPNDLPLPDWEPGAHIDVVLPNGCVRQYSLCGHPSDGRVWKIAILHEPNSRGGSRYIHRSLQAGDIITVAGPRNNFALADAGNYIFIAGGIGITPILPMLAAASRSSCPWTLVYGGRTRASMAFLESIEKIHSARVEIVPQDEAGLIDLDKYLAVPREDTLVYCCGPGPMIDAVERASSAWPPRSLRRERFAPKQQPEAAAGDRDFEVELALSGRVLTIAEDDNLLAELEKAGCQIANSCRAGICGTCVLKVLGGIPDHRDDLLDDEQRAANQMILPCVSRSMSKRLVLEI